MLAILYKRGWTLTVFFEDEFAFFRFVFIFASSAIFTSFAFVLGLHTLVDCSSHRRGAYHDGVDE
jgi:hypothetical protein